MSSSRVYIHWIRGYQGGQIKMSKKEVLEQEYNEYAEGIIDPTQFHKTFYHLLKAFQVLDGTIPKWSKIITPTMTIFTLIALILLSISLYNATTNIFDITLITEVGNYFIILFYQLLMISCTKLNLSNYHDMQRIIKEDFTYICTHGEKYRQKFFLNQIKNRKIYNLSLKFTTLSNCSMTSYTFASLIYHLITHEQGEGKRPLLFPLWFFEVDVNASPIYEIAFIYCNLCTASYGFIYCFMLGTQIIWIREIGCKADIVTWLIQDVLDGIQPTKNERERNCLEILIRKRMREVLRHHNSMYILLDHYAGVYKKLLMMEQSIAAPVVCLSAYAAAEKWEMGEPNLILAVLCIAAIILLFIPCYLCTFLANKMNSVCYACWQIPFWNAGPVIRPYLLLIMQRSLRPLPLKAPGFEEVSIETFSKKMASAYSFFNMLRQANI